MDPNIQSEALPQIPNVQTKAIFTKRKLILVASLVVAVIIAALLLNYFRLLPFGKSRAISKPAPVTLNLARGSITSIEGTNITVDVHGKGKSFSIAQTKEFSKIVSGSIGTNDAKTGTAQRADLKVGQEVLVIADLSSTDAKTIYILH